MTTCSIPPPPYATVVIFTSSSPHWLAQDWHTHTGFRSESKLIWSLLLYLIARNHKGAQRNTSLHCCACHSVVCVCMSEPLCEEVEVGVEHSLLIFYKIKWSRKIILGVPSTTHRDLSNDTTHVMQFGDYPILRLTWPSSRLMPHIIVSCLSECFLNV